ncbi:Fe-S cluster assembly protein SufD, partial [Allofrancisella guangzhouensis]|nr:Fe-S cluster assembly protein SufD [Allofrancisella guangzhouensis]
MLINKDSLPTIKQESWKYTDLAAIYDKNNIIEILKESLQTKDYLEGFKFDTQEKVIIIIDGVLAIDYHNKLTPISSLEFNKDTRKMSKLAIENSKHFMVETLKNTRDCLSLIFINTENAKGKLTNISLKLKVGIFANLNLDIDFVNLTSNSAINLFLDMDLAESAKI